MDCVAELSLYEDMYTLFMCRNCNATLGDGTSLCGGNDILGVIAFLRVTADVVLNESSQIGFSEGLEDCIYHILRCKVCDSSVGFNLYCATRPYTHLRGLFCLLKTEILCYRIKNKTMIQGIHTRIDFKTFMNHMQELRESLIEMSQRLDTILLRITNQDTLEKL